MTMMLAPPTNRYRYKAAKRFSLAASDLAKAFSMSDRNSPVAALASVEAFSVAALALVKP